MARVLALLDDDASLGFRLTGVETKPVRTAEDLAREAEAAAADPEIRIVILDEALFRRLPERLEKKLEESTAPIYVPIPTVRLRRGEVRPEEYVARLIRRAIGYQIKIKR